jgi:hypothetical protein
MWKHEEERAGETGYYILPDLPSGQLDKRVQLRHVGAQMLDQFNSIS